MPEERFAILNAAPSAAIIIYCIGAGEEMTAVAALVRDLPCILIAVPCENWNRDLSPWPAPPVFRNEGFSGGAPAFLRQLTEEIIPQAEAVLCAQGIGVPPVRAVCGYSLAGLFALWAAAGTGSFACAASVSGSLWFDGFTAWLETCEELPRCVYLSIGDREAHTKNERMKRGQQAAEQTLALLQERGCEAVFRLNPGNHFQDVPQRMADAIRWLASR